MKYLTFRVNVSFLVSLLRYILVGIIDLAVLVRAPVLDVNMQRNVIFSW